MPELEQLIADWRKHMRAAGIRSPDPLDELEAHLRDDVEQQMRSGSDMQSAFEAAVKHIGGPIELHREFQQAYSSMTENMKAHLRNLLAGIAIAATGLGLVLPAFAKSRASEALVTFDMTVCTLGAIGVVFGAAWAAISIVRLLKQRS